MLFTKKLKLEKQLMAEIKALAKVDEFPYKDAKTIADLLVAYNKGSSFVAFSIMAALDTLEKYPDLADNWDDLMIKYKTLGLFPKWDVAIF